MGNFRSRQRLEDLSPDAALKKWVGEYNADHDWHRLSKRLRKLMKTGTPERLQMERLDMYSRNVLRNAAACDFAELLKVLLNGGLNIDEPVDNEGNTLLHVAVRNGHSGLLHMLLKRGANPGVCNRLGLTPKDMAARANNPLMMSIFTSYEPARLQSERLAEQASGGDLLPPLLPLPTRR